MRLNNFKKRLLTSFVLFLLIYLIFNFNYILGFTLIVLGIISILEFTNITKKIYGSSVKTMFISNLIFSVFVFLFCVLFFIFSNFFHLKLILFILLFGCIASDVGGLLFGKLFNGPKLTKISPNKTIAGSIGSIFLTCLLTIIFLYFFNKDFYLIGFILGFAISISCQIGDLFFSYLKRKAKIKDTGKIFPGHGGVLDRLDSIFFGIPIGLIVHTLIN